MKKEIDAALTEIRIAVPGPVHQHLDSPDRWRFCDLINGAIQILEAIRQRTSKWNVVVRWVLGALIDGMEARLRKECPDL